MQIHNFTEAKQALRQFYNKDTTYTLERMRQLMQVLGNPQDKLRVLHVAGTSGKTSTAYYAAALLTAAGHKTGLTVSPHVDEINERVQIDMQPLDEIEFCQALSQMIERIKQSQLEPSYFELMIALAYSEFARQNVDYAVIEVGLGGALDGTNVVSRADKICLITDIGLDHTEVLGNTLSQIASHKAGIIQAQNQAFMHPQANAIMHVVTARTKEVQGRLSVVPQDRVEQSILPLFQQRNITLAQAAVDYALKRDFGTRLTETIIQAAAAVPIPARMEALDWHGKTVIMDGAHNQQKLAALLESVHLRYGQQPITALVAFVKGQGDSRWQQAVNTLLPAVDQLIITSFQTDQDVPKQAVDPNVIAAYINDRGFANTVVTANWQQALGLLKQSNTSINLIGGSFYLLNDIRPHLLAEV